MRRSLLILAVLVGSAALIYPLGARLLAAKSFLRALSAAEASAPRVEQQELEIASADGPIRARLYRASGGGPHRGVVVAHGVHYQGIDERRLVPFARALARTGLNVLTPELVDLADYRLTNASVVRISAAVSYLARRNDLAENGRVGLLGFSFAGGLALVAAAQPQLENRLDYVVSVGGHHDLDRVFRFLLTSQVTTPNGVVKLKAHEYGLAVLLYAYLSEFLVEPELSAARPAFRAWLQEDQAKARSIAQGLTGKGADLFRLLEGQRLAELSPELTAIVERDRETLGALSPKGTLGRVRVPVYLLHGSHDSVIPASEADFANLELVGRAHERLITPLIEHVELSREASFAEKAALLVFLSRLF